MTPNEGFYLHLILKTLDDNLTNFLRIHRAKSGATLMRYFKPVLNPKEKLLWIDRNIDLHFHVDLQFSQMGFGGAENNTI